MSLSLRTTSLALLITAAAAAAAIEYAATPENTETQTPTTKKAVLTPGPGETLLTRQSGTETTRTWNVTIPDDTTLTVRAYCADTNLNFRLTRKPTTPATHTPDNTTADETITCKNTTPQKPATTPLDTLTPGDYQIVTTRLGERLPPAVVTGLTIDNPEAPETDFYKPATGHQPWSIAITGKPTP